MWVHQGAVDARNASEIMIRMRAVMAMSLTLGGCMMPGMMGMGGMGGAGMSGAEHPATHPTMIKETVMQGIRVTATFPSYASDDTVTYAVTVTRVPDASPISDVSLTMLVTADTGAVPAAPYPPAHAHALSRDSSVAGRQATVPSTAWTPTPSGSGAFVFHPAIPLDGAHRVLVVLDRVEGRRLDPPIELEHVVALNRRLQPPSGSGSGGGGHAMGGWGSSTLVIAGAAVMAIMMVVSRR